MRSSASTVLASVAAAAMLAGASADTVAAPRPTGRGLGLGGPKTSFRDAHACVGGNIALDGTWTSPCDGHKSKCCPGFTCKEYDGEIAASIGDNKRDSFVSFNAAPFQYPEYVENFGECCYPEAEGSVVGFFCEVKPSYNSYGTYCKVYDIYPEIKDAVKYTDPQDALDNLACMCCEGTVGYKKYNDKIFLDCNVEVINGKNTNGNGYDKYGKCGYGYGK